MKIGKYKIIIKSQQSEILGLSKLIVSDIYHTFCSFPSTVDQDLPFGEPKSQAGQKKGLQLVLDAHSDRISIGSVFDTFKGFMAVVGNKNEYPLTKKHGFLLRAGQENYVSLSATKIEANENIRPIEISPGKRECYFHDEHPLKLHQKYSQANCIIECTIQYAREKMESKCTPWYYPGT